MFKPSVRGESINRRFRYIVGVIYLVVLVIVVWLFVIQWQGYWDAYQAKYEYQALQATLRAMADISTERRPAYVVMMTQEQPTPERQVLLTKARASTDARMQEVDVALRDARCRHCATLLPAWAEANTQLQMARQRLDALSSMPLQSREDDDVLDAFFELSGVIPKLSAIADAGSIGVIRENADVQSYMMAARLAALIREHAGMLASEFAPALVRHRPFNNIETQRIASTIGKIEQLGQLLAPVIKVLPADLQADYLDMRKRYLEDGLQFARQLETKINQGSGLEMSALELADRYGPMIAPINRFRDNALALAHERIDQSLRSHLLLLLGTGTFALALTFTLLLMMWRFRERVIQPFADARRFILAIASGKLTAKLPDQTYGSEVQELFRALIVLRENSAKRLQLEQERKRLIGELRTMADTDPLTGLLNRRALEDRAQGLLDSQRSNSEPMIAVIMMDIDHFKRVNDTWGHESGDLALLALASVCRDTVRAEDIVARTGGEEFVIVLGVQRAENATLLAEKLRERLQEESVQAIDGSVFSVTASFGVTFAARDASPELADLLRTADALLYKAKENGRDRVETAPL